MKEIKSIIEKLPAKYKSCFAGIDTRYLKLISEIRFRSRLPCAVSSSVGNGFLTVGNIISSPNNSCPISTPEELVEIVSSLCEYSVFSHSSSIANGYITIRGGHRIGICGTLNQNGLVDISSISSINVRIAHEIVGCAAEVALKTQQLGLASVLIAGVPLSGKTTIIRDFTRILAQDPSFTKCTVIDERGEIAAIHAGESVFNLGVSTDIIDRYPRKQGFDIALRALSPQVIVCDEIGLTEDYDSFMNCEKSGVKLIATVHSNCLEDLKKKENVWRLVKNGVFDYVVFLHEYPKTGKIKNFYKVV